MSRLGEALFGKPITTRAELNERIHMGDVIATVVKGRNGLRKRLGVMQDDLGGVTVLSDKQKTWLRVQPNSAGNGFVTFDGDGGPVPVKIKTPGLVSRRR